jgi:hypothetical protein
LLTEQQRQQIKVLQAQIKPSQEDQSGDKCDAHKKKKKRKAGDPPTTIRQQNDERVREKLQGVFKPMKMTQKMSTPLSRQDGYAAQAGGKDKLAEKQARWPHTIHGIFCFTEQEPNGDGNNGESGDFLATPRLVFNVGSEYTKGYFQKFLEDHYNFEDDVEVVCTVSSEEYMGALRSESAKRKQEMIANKKKQQGPPKNKKRRKQEELEEEDDFSSSDDDTHLEDEHGNRIDEYGNIIGYAL